GGGQSEWGCRGPEEQGGAYQQPADGKRRRDSEGSPLEARHQAKEDDRSAQHSPAREPARRAPDDEEDPQQRRRGLDEREEGEDPEDRHDRLPLRTAQKGDNAVGGANDERPRQTGDTGGDTEDLERVALEAGRIGGEPGKGTRGHVRDRGHHLLHGPHEQVLRAIVDTDPSRPEEIPE